MKVNAEGETAWRPVMYGLAAVMEYYYRSASTCWGWISDGGRRPVVEGVFSKTCRRGAMRVTYDNATRETRPRGYTPFPAVSPPFSKGPSLSLSSIYTRFIFIYLYRRHDSPHVMTFFQELISQTSIVRMSDTFLLNGEFMPRRTCITRLYNVYKPNDSNLRKSIL